MSRETLVLSSFWARNGLRESTLCATATVSVLLPLSAACACWGGAAPRGGMPGTTDRLRERGRRRRSQEHTQT